MRAVVRWSGPMRNWKVILESDRVLADALTAHAPGRDTFHRVPIFSGK
jgi:hypothetical protein